jgi:hypothetical protein
MHGKHVYIFLFTIMILDSHAMVETYSSPSQLYNKQNS